MAQFKPVRIGDTVPLQQINPATEEIDGKIYVSQSGVVLGRVSSGDGPHEEILLGDLPGGPGGASYTEITYADMATAIAGSTLTPGGWYLVTDATGTDLGFLTNAVTENTINVSGVGGYLNPDFQAVGDYSGTPETFNAQLGIWHIRREVLTVPYANLTPDEIAYTTSTGLLTDGETFTSDYGSTGAVVTDDGSTVFVRGVTQPLLIGETLYGDISGNAITVDVYTTNVFSVGDTITGGTTGATGEVISDNGIDSMQVKMTSPGVLFDGSEAIDNGDGSTADMDGATTGPEIQQGDVVIWDGIHYQLTDAAQTNYTDPAANTDAYTLLGKGTYPETYIVSWDIAEYNVANNEIVYTQDLQGGLIRGATAVAGYPFGRADASGNTVQNPAEFSVKNLIGTLQNNTVLQGGVLRDLTSWTGTNFDRNTIENGGSLYDISATVDCSVSGNVVGPAAILGDLTTMDNESEIDGNTLAANVYFGGLTLGKRARASANTFGPGVQVSGIIFQYLAYIADNRLETNASILDTVLGLLSYIETNVFFIGASLRNCIFQKAAYFTGNIIYPAVIIDSKTFDGVGFARNEIGVNMDEPETITDNIFGKRAIRGFSDIPGTIDITGLTTLDCTAAWGQYRGVYNLTSTNATEAIDTITNPPTLFPFTLRPAAGLTLTITGTAYSGIAAGQIALKATDYVLDGDKGEYIVLELDPLGTGALIEKQVVNGLI